MAEKKLAPKNGILTNGSKQVTVIAFNEKNALSVLDSLNKNQTNGELDKMKEDNAGKNTGHKDYFEQIYDSTPEAILILDENNIVIDSNKGFEKMFLYNSREVTGKTKEELIVPEHFLDDSKELITRLNAGEYIQQESIRQKKDGRPVNVLITGSRIKLSENRYGSYIIYVDISKHKRSEEQMRSSLVEKEVLIREIHHRVKNNLQIISSLLHIQAGKISNKELAAMFTDCQNRVKSIALIHEKLYQTNSFTRVDFGSYTRNLVYYLFRMFNVKSDKVSLRMNAENVFLPMDTAIPCGLIINELVTNSLKHAFNGDKQYEISIEIVYQSNNKFTLTVKDNGSGIPETVNFQKALTVGFNLINNLVKQLGGILEINSTEGTEFKITFSILNQ